MKKDSDGLHLRSILRSELTLSDVLPSDAQFRQSITTRILVDRKVNVLNRQNSFLYSSYVADFALFYGAVWS